jgi:hypothetical protein
MVARGTPDEPLLLATLPPSNRQVRLVFVILAIFGVVFAVVMPFANTPLPRFDAWVPSFTTALIVTDLITSNSCIPNSQSLASWRSGAEGRTLSELDEEPEPQLFG